MIDKKKRTSTPTEDDPEQPEAFRNAARELEAVGDLKPEKDDVALVRILTQSGKRAQDPNQP